MEVRKYIDKRGWKFKVKPGIGTEEFKGHFQRDGYTGPLHWRGMSNLTWRKTFEEAQADLDALAAKKGWQEWTEPDHTRQTDISSHSEAAIFRGCVSLMQKLTRRFEEYLDCIGIKPDDAEGFSTSFFTTEMIGELFLKESGHDCGTARRLKKTALLLHEESIVFQDQRSFEPEPENKGM